MEKHVSHLKKKKNCEKQNISFTLFVYSPKHHIRLFYIDFIIIIIVVIALALAGLLFLPFYYSMHTFHQCHSLSIRFQRRLKFLLHPYSTTLTLLHLFNVFFTDNTFAGISLCMCVCVFVCFLDNFRFKVRTCRQQ